MNIGERSAEVWRGLHRAYGDPFITLYGTDPHPLWVTKINELTDEQCRGALAKLSNLPKEKRGFPVNLTEFEKVARASTPWVQPARQQTQHRGYDPRRGPPASPESRAHHLASIRAKLGGQQ